MWGFPSWGIPKRALDGLFYGTSIYKWMITRVTPRKPPYVETHDKMVLSKFRSWTTTIEKDIVTYP